MLEYVRDQPLDMARSIYARAMSKLYRARARYHAERPSYETWTGVALGTILALHSTTTDCAQSAINLARAQYDYPEHHGAKYFRHERHYTARHVVLCDQRDTIAREIVRRYPEHWLSAYVAMRDVATLRGWPTHYRGDLLEHDYLWIARHPYTRFTWILRELGTHIIGDDSPEMLRAVQSTWGPENIRVYRWDPLSCTLQRLTWKAHDRTYFLPVTGEWVASCAK